MRRMTMAALILVGALGGALSGVAFLGGGDRAARAQDNTNSVVACYEDRTYEHVTWGNVGDLMTNEGVVEILVLHSQSPGPPNIIQLAGHDRYALRAVPAGLLARTSDVPPGTENAVEHIFRTAGSQEFNRDLGNSGTGNGIGGGMHAYLYTADYNAPDYDDKVADCIALANTFRAQAVPNSGTY